MRHTRVPSCVHWMILSSSLISHVCCMVTGWVRCREGLEIEGMCDWVVRATNRSDCEQVRGRG